MYACVRAWTCMCVRVRGGPGECGGSSMPSELGLAILLALTLYEPYTVQLNGFGVLPDSGGRRSPVVWVCPVVGDSSPLPQVRVDQAELGPG